MTDQVTAETTARQQCQPAPAKHDTLAVLAFIFGILLWPLGIYLGHASCEERGQDRQLSAGPGAESGSGRARLSDMIRPCVLHTFFTRSPCNLRASGVFMFVLLACNFDNARWQPAQDDLLLAKCLLNPDRTLLTSELVDQQPDD